MQKINFQDLPSTTTPINASNLNQIQTNTENAINSINTLTLIHQRAYSSGWQTEGTFSSSAKYVYFLLTGGTYGSFSVLMPVSLLTTLTTSAPYIIQSGTTTLYQFAYDNGNIRGYFRSSATDYSVAIYEVD